MLARILDYATLSQLFRQNAGTAHVYEYGSVEEGGRVYPLLALRTPGPRELVITSGFHGEEPAGPITLARHVRTIFDEATAAGVGLRIYPCINPSGFEHRHRYNVSGEKPNNDLLRYEVAPGVWKGELTPEERFLRWVVFDGGPKETRALRAELERHGTPHAALDLHQDYALAEARLYAYVFGERSRYLPLVADCERHLEIARRTQVDVGLHTDGDGLIEFHDGSVTDYYLRRGTPFAAALETTTRTPQELCERANLIWIRGFIELAAKG
jgi:predicted deacylase